MATVKFLVQRTGLGLAIFAPQLGNIVVPPTGTLPLEAGPPSIVQGITTGGLLTLAVLFVDKPAPRSRTVFMPAKNNRIRL